MMQTVQFLERHTVNGIQHASGCVRPVTDSLARILLKKGVVRLLGETPTGNGNNPKEKGNHGQ